jgi:hypothetical protein
MATRVTFAILRPQTEGWVEPFAKTHRIATDQKMGFAALNPHLLNINLCIQNGPLEQPI